MIILKFDQSVLFKVSMPYDFMPIVCSVYVFDIELSYVQVLLGFTGFENIGPFDRRLNYPEDNPYWRNGLNKPRNSYHRIIDRYSRFNCGFVVKMLAIFHDLVLCIAIFCLKSPIRVRKNRESNFINFKVNILNK